jgi:uncharacterized protein YecT (DUF1311 family)
MKSFLVLLVFLFTSNPIWSQQQEDPIDADLTKCMENDPTTNGMLECYAQAEKRWDGELNKAYKDLMAQINDDSKAALKTSQISWLKYRDQEFIAISAIYGSFEGTMFLPMAASERLKIIRDRVYQLRGYLSSCEISK